MNSLNFEQMEKVEGGVSKWMASGWICGAGIAFSASAAFLPLGIAVLGACAFAIYASS